MYMYINYILLYLFKNSIYFENIFIIKIVNILYTDILASLC